jgi:hypothetical protein
MGLAAMAAFQSHCAAAAALEAIVLAQVATVPATTAAVWATLIAMSLTVVAVQAAAPLMHPGAVPPPRPEGLLEDDLADQLLAVLPPEGRLLGQQFVQRGAKGVNVGPVVHVHPLGERLLGAVGRLDVAVHDSQVVGALEGLGGLDAEIRHAPEEGRASRGRGGQAADRPARAPAAALPGGLSGAFGPHRSGLDAEHAAVASRLAACGLAEARQSSQVR